MAIGAACVLLCACRSPEPATRSGPPYLRFQVVEVADLGAEHPRAMRGVLGPELVRGAYEALPEGICEWAVEIALEPPIGFGVVLERCALGTDRGITASAGERDGRFLFGLPEGTYELQDILLGFRVPGLANTVPVTVVARAMRDPRAPLSFGRKVTTRIELRAEARPDTKLPEPKDRIVPP